MCPRFPGLKRKRHEQHGRLRRRRLQIVLHRQFQERLVVLRHQKPESANPQGPPAVVSDTDVHQHVRISDLVSDLNPTVHLDIESTRFHEQVHWGEAGTAQARARRQLQPRRSSQGKSASIPLRFLIRYGLKEPAAEWRAGGPSISSHLFGRRRRLGTRDPRCGLPSADRSSYAISPTSSNHGPGIPSGPPAFVPASRALLHFASASCAALAAPHPPPSTPFK